MHDTRVNLGAKELELEQWFLGGLQGHFVRRVCRFHM